MSPVSRWAYKVAKVEVAELGRKVGVHLFGIRAHRLHELAERGEPDADLVRPHSLAQGFHHLQMAGMSHE